MTVLVAPAEHPPSAECTFELQRTQRVDPTERLTLITVSAAFQAPPGTADPRLLLRSPDGMKLVTPLWATRESETWSAEFAFASARLSADDTALVLFLPDRRLVDLPVPEPSEPARRPPRTIAVLSAAFVLGLGGSLGWQQLQDQGSSSSSSSTAEPAPVGADEDTPVRRPLAPARIVAQTPERFTLVAHTVRRRIGLYRSQRATKPWMFLPNRTATGAPTVFMVRQGAGSRFKVALPIRPNGSTGWIRATDVRLTRVDYRIRVELGRHRLTIWRGGRSIIRTPVGVGRGVTPTPVGIYYVTALLKQPDPEGTFGPYAFALSGHSDVIEQFAGGNGRIGIHGTNQPSGLGSDVSHGCIRVANGTIRRLARMLPLGTPVRISSS